jgi:hypothetical protein
MTMCSTGAPQPYQHLHCPLLHVPCHPLHTNHPIPAALQVVLQAAAPHPSCHTALLFCGPAASQPCWLLLWVVLLVLLLWVQQQRSCACQ